MNIFERLRQDIIHAGRTLQIEEEYLQNANVEMPRDTSNGDLSTSIAMILAAKLAAKPLELALQFKELLLNVPYIAGIEVAKPGFINFTLKNETWHECIMKLVKDEEGFKMVDIGKGQSINIEYVSANPTGPLHIGHTRCAVYGDALARLLAHCGYKVTKEYYINDAGSQIDALTKTVLLRYEEILTGKKAEIPPGLYPGEYLIEVGARLANEFGDKILVMAQKEQQKLVKEFAVSEMMKKIKEDLLSLGIEHEVFFSEASLHESGKILEAVQILKAKGLVYEGSLPAPKGKLGEEWTEREQLLFKSTTFGDSQDRPLQKSLGEWSYLAADLAYAQDKIDRGYERLVYVLGADHGGYVKRIEGVVQAFSEGRIKCDVKICQLVNFVDNGVPIKMSKRQGNFTTVKEVIDEVGKDIIRFIMLTRKNDAPLDFDLEKVKEQSKENPVFYVQYAHVRTVSILENSKQVLPSALDKFLAGKFDLSLLAAEEEVQLIKLIAAWPKLLEGAAMYFEPHRIAFYLLNIAAKFHALWNFGKENNNYRFIVEKDIELTAARLVLVSSIQKIITYGLAIIGVTPLNKM